MAFLSFANAILLLRLISFFTMNPLHGYAVCPEPAPAPKPPTLVLIPIMPPTMSPAKPPMMPPMLPPVKPPMMPPMMPPMLPPVKPPMMPPMLPPVQPPMMPPMLSPVQPPMMPPMLPPVKPPMMPPMMPPMLPPMMPPMLPPVNPPMMPPMLPPVQSPMMPPMLPPVNPPMMPPMLPPVKPPMMPPMMPPMLPPVKPPMMPPMLPPVKPHMLPPGKSVAVLGAVFCESVCRYMGDYNKLTRVSPLEGAEVKLACNDNNTTYTLVVQTKTDKSGYFLMTPPNLTADGVKNCRAFLVKSPNPKCSVPTKLNDGSTGATLTPTVNSPYKERLLAYSLFNVGPLAFQPAKIRRCHY